MVQGVIRGVIQGANRELRVVVVGAGLAGLAVARLLRRAGVKVRVLRVFRLPFAQFAQPAGFSAALPGNETPLPNVYLASEATGMSSVQGALESGERAVALILGQGVRARGA